MENLLCNLSSYSKVFFYMPTWRDSNPNFITESGLDFFEIDQVLKSTNSFLILKLHIATPPSSLKSLHGLENIHVMDARDDIYPVLPQSSALITDYSSIYLDYLLLDRPICFFVFDISLYLSESRGFYHTFDEFAPGLKALTAAQITKFLQSEETNVFQAERDQLCTKLFAHYDGGASERIAKFFKSQFHKF